MLNKLRLKRTGLVILTIIGLAFLPAISSHAVCPDDIFSYWNLDEPTGPPNSEYVDIIRRNDGTGTAGLVAGTGKVGGAQDFNGTDTKIEVDADRFFDWAAGDSFSIEAWVKTDGVAPNVFRPIISRIDPADVNLLQWWIGINNDGSGNAIFVYWIKPGPAPQSPRRYPARSTLPTAPGTMSWPCGMPAIRPISSTSTVSSRAEWIVLPMQTDSTMPAAQVNIGRLDYLPRIFF